MKINPLISYPNYFTDPAHARVSEKQNVDPEGDRETPQQQLKDGNEDSPETFPENLEQAVEDFQKDQQVQNNGIQASVEGQGPGLKVVLKDAQGGVLKALSGEDFLKLRSSVLKISGKSGKILDQKL